MSSHEQNPRIRQNLIRDLTNHEIYDCWLGSNEVDALNALIHWLQGYVAAGKGFPPGYYELITVYRKLRLSAAAMKMVEEHDRLEDK